MIDPGTVAQLELLAHEMTSPPIGAIEEIDTVPVAIFPPLTVAGLSEINLTTGGVMVSVALCAVPPRFAVTNALVTAATGMVLTTKEALVRPELTTKVVNKLAEAVFVVSVIFNPPEGAGLESLTVPTELVPPATVLGTNEREVRLGELIISVPLADPPFSVAVTTTDV